MLNPIFFFYRDEKLIREAIERSDFLNKILKGNLLKEVVGAMYSREIKQKQVIIKEGRKGVAHVRVGAGSLRGLCEGQRGREHI
jgi:hypothetical protein